MDSCNDTLAGGLPHSDIHGSKPARGSPWLFAACHVLHRLLVPRHPPNALLILDTSTSARSRQPPCTETILRLSCQGSRPLPEANPQPRTIDCSRTVLELSTSHTTGSSSGPSPHPLLRRWTKTVNQTRSFTTPLNPRCRPWGAILEGQHLPVRHATERRDQCQSSRSVRDLGEQHGSLPITRAQRRTRT